MQKLSDDVTSRCSDDSITWSSNTTMNDWTDAKSVLKKCTQGSCLWSEFNNFIYSGTVPEQLQSYIDIVFFEGYRDSYRLTSSEVTRLQRNILDHYKNGEGVVNDNQFSCNGSVD